jgi:NitT/TauT family transport system permease protein
MNPIIAVALLILILTALRWFGPKLISPNESISSSTYTYTAIAWLLIVLLVWATSASPILPSPAEVVRAVPNLWFQEGLGEQLWVSFTLNLQAIGIMVMVSLIISYLTVVPVFRPVGTALGMGRFSGFVGLPLILTLYLGNAHWIKVALLVYGVSVFTVPATIRTIELIPKEAFDHARTLRMHEWRVVWEVVILGRFDDVIEILRVNIAMMWMLLPMVEGLFKSEGGLGALLDVQNKHFALASEYAVLFVVLAVGMLQDYVIGVFKGMLCPYAELNLERS